LARINNENNESYSISNYIYDFIQKFHSIYSIYFDIKNLIENIEEEKKYIYAVCKKFLDKVFFDVDTYMMKLENGNENLDDNSVNNKNNEERNDGDDEPFLKEKKNLV